MAFHDGTKLGCLFVATLWICAAPVRGQVTNVAGSASAQVRQYNGIVEVQRDSSQEIVPTTTPAPPAAARARLDHLLQDGSVTAAGQVVALFDTPNLSGFGPPNDVGLDLGAFSEDDITSWVVHGSVTETRTLRMSPADLGIDIRWGDRGRLRSRIVLSGVLLITASRQDQDLSETEARFSFSVTQRFPNQEPLELLSGGLTLVGGPGGGATVQRATGVLAAAPAIVDIAPVVEGLPVVRALGFNGTEFTYEYEAAVNQPFDLVLTVDAQVQTTPGGIGAAVVFGLPQEGLPAVLQRVKQSDVGQQLAAAISEYVDTTGQAQRQELGAGAAPIPVLAPACGWVGLEAVVTLMVVGQARRRHRWGRPRPGRAAEGERRCW